jgi:tetratricopeptide (TPR) repeat protein
MSSEQNAAAPPAITGSARRIVRVAVAQLAYHPAIHGALVDPLGEPDPEGKLPRSTLPPGFVPPQDALGKAHGELGKRVEAAYLDQLVQKLRAVVEACRAWDVRLLVLPEYSVPVGALPAVAAAAGDMVVVAGSCFVDREVQNSPVYGELHAPSKPERRWNVAHVLHRGRIVALVPKLQHIDKEQRFPMKQATAWAPVEIPEDFGGPLGVLICLDYTYRGSGAFRELVGSKLDQCRVIAAPALTSESSQRFFEGHHIEESGPERRPVLFANYADGGGSTIVAGERTMDEVRAFPLSAGVLDKGEEGVLVADLDLSIVGTGKGGRYGEPPRCMPFAAASLVYTGTTPELAKWLSDLRDLLPETSSDDDEDDVLDRAVEWLSDHPPPRGDASPTQKRRWDRMLGGLQHETSVEALRRLIREIVLPPEVLPRAAVQDALASGAAREIDRWTQAGYAGAAPFATVAAKLAERSRKAEARRVAWADAARRAWAGIADATRAVAGQTPHAVIMLLDRASDTVENQIVKAALDKGNALAAEGRLEDARAAFERALGEAERQGEGNEVHGDKWRVWVARAAIGAATCSANLQDVDRARAFLERVPTDALDARRRVRAANVWAGLGEVERARALLPAAGTLSEEDAREARDVLLRIDLVEGRVPSDEDLESSPDVALVAAVALLTEQHDAARAARLALGSLEAPNAEPLVRAEALRLLIATLVETTLEQPPSMVPIPPEERPKVVEAVESRLPEVFATPLPAPTLTPLRSAWRMLLQLTDDTDALSTLKEAGAADQDEAQDETEEEKARGEAAQTAERLAREGHVEAALQVLPAEEHPWRRRLYRVDVLRLAGQADRALAEVLRLSEELPGRARVEMKAAHLLSQAGRHSDALKHAEEGAKALPARGLRVLVAERLLALQRADEAWNLLAGDEPSAGPRILRALAVAAEQAHPEDALDRWEKYVAANPRDAEAGVQVALLHFAQNQPERAVKAAWTTFEAHADALRVDDLHRLAVLQGAPLPEAERRRRVQLVAATLRRRFPGDPRAEQARLALLTPIGAIESGAERVDFALLQRAGFVRAMKTSELLEWMRATREVTTFVQQFGKQGNLPIALFCGAVTPPVSVPVVIARLIHGNWGVVPFSPPVSLSDLPPGFRLEASQLLVSEVELYLLGALGLLPALRERIADGSVHLFRGAWVRVVEDRGALQAETNEQRRKGLDETVAALALLPRLVGSLEQKGMSDEQVALQRGMMIVASSPADTELRAASSRAAVSEERRISPGAVIQWIAQDGRISADVASALAPFFAQDTETSRPDSTQAPVLVSAFVLEKLHKHGALRAFLDLFPGAHIGEHGWRGLLDQQARDMEDRKAAELAADVHAWIVDGMRDGLVHIVPDPDPEGLPALLEPDNESHQDLIEEPLRWAARYADTLAAHPSWWRLTADFFGSTSPLSPEAPPLLVWGDREREARALVKRLRAGAERHLSLPILIRLLFDAPVAATRRHQALFKLAELGFPDALGEDEIPALFRAFGGLEGDAPARILDRLEWMAREPGHLGGDTARLRLAAAYGAAVFRAFCGTRSREVEDKHASAETVEGSALPVAEAAALGRTLLGRAEALSQRQSIDLLDTVIRFLGASTASNPLLAWERNANANGWERKVDGPLANLWEFVQSWAGPDGQRRAAYERGIREVWLLVDSENDEARLQLIGTALDHAVEVRHARGTIRFMSVAIEAETILSALWTWRPTSVRGIDLSGPGVPEQTVRDEDVLAFGARPETQLDLDPNGRFLRFAFPVSSTSGTLEVIAPTEAILLRQAPDDDRTRELATVLMQSQGPHDGRAYRLLAGLARHPSRKSIRRAVSRRAASALWRAVRDDPTYLVRWPRSRGIGSSGAKPTLRELRAILSEPDELGPEGAHFGKLLMERFGERGAWRREDAGALLKMAFEVPGDLMFGAVGHMLADRDHYEGHVAEALYVAERCEDHPIARVGRSILLLRGGAARKPLVKLPSGESVDLREKLPDALRKVLERTMVAPIPGTFADAEPPLLRVCMQVLFDIAGRQRLSIRDGLWLTYRLFQWLSAQLDALPSDARNSAFRELVAIAPKPAAPMDRLDPRGFGREAFDHRLATVLFALAAMENLGPVLDTAAPSRDTPPYRLAWQPAMIDSLVDLAGRLDESLGLRSVLPWLMPDNISDLALVALLRVDPNAFARVPAPARLARIQRLPEDPEAEDPEAQALFLPLVMQAGVHVGSLLEEERQELLSRIRALPKAGEIASRWRMQVLPAFYSHGTTDVTEAEATLAVQERLGDPLAPMALTFLLLGTAARDPGRTGAVLNGVLQEAERRSIDAMPLVAGVGRVALFVDEPVRTTLVEEIRALSKKPPFKDDDRMRELLAALESG